MAITLRCTEIPAGPGEAEAPGTVYSFVPAHGQSDAGAVVKTLCRSLSEDLGQSVLLADFCSRGFPLWGTPEAPQRLDRKTWGAFLILGVPFDSLDTKEAHPREIPRLLAHARKHYGVTCADLSGATQMAALEALRHSDGIFVVTDSDAASLKMARFKAEWLRSLKVAENCGLLLNRVPGGVSFAEAEEITGLPVCAQADYAAQMDRLAGWLAARRQAA